MREALRNPAYVLQTLEENAKDPQYRFRRLYRNLYNPEFFYQAYQNISSKQGNMTPGSDGKTMSGMGEKRVNAIIESLKNHSYNPQPARRTYIKKKSGNMRPLGIPSTDDKLVQEVVKMMLESIYEPSFHGDSHGFRPERSCHTALAQIEATFTGVKWFIEGDIHACFDSFDHYVLIEILRKRIADEYFISLMWKFLKAGYMEQWKFHGTYTGTPQGSGISPILSNIYLNELDEYMTKLKGEYDKGNPRKRKANRSYGRLSAKSGYRSRRFKLKWNSMSKDERKQAAREVKGLKAEMRQYPYWQEYDPDFKRIYYCRYADDFIIGVIGSKEDAENIKSRIKEFLSATLKLQMSDEKTKVTHGNDFARFLGYDVTISADNNVIKDKNGVLKKSFRGNVKLYVPKEKWVGKLIEKRAFIIKIDENGKERWKPAVRGNLINLTPDEIVGKYNGEIRGLYNFYRLADNATVISKFAHIMEYSMYATFARKYDSSIKKIIHEYTKDGRFVVTYNTTSGVRQAVFYNDRFKKAAAPLKYDVDALPQYMKYQKPRTLKLRLKSGVCELCKTSGQELTMFQVRRLKDLGSNDWERLMRARRRKTLAVCSTCFGRMSGQLVTLNERQADGEP